MSRYSKNARRVNHTALIDQIYLGVESGYNVFQRKDARGYTALKSDDRNDRIACGSMAEISSWIEMRIHAA